MAKFKVQETTTTEKEIEISLPCYRKNLRGDVMYKIINEKEAVKVQNYGMGIRSTVTDGINFCSAKFALCEDTFNATQEEFETKYAEILVILSQVTLCE